MSTDSLPGLVTLIGLVLMILWLSISFKARSRAMRALAVRFGLNYVGPKTPKFIFGYMPKIMPHLPFSRRGYPLDTIRQIWNLMEGECGGMHVLVFDGLFYQFAGINQFCTFIACETEESPFGMKTRSDRISDCVVRPHGWTVLYRVPFPLLNPFRTWTMTVQHIEYRLNELSEAAPSLPRDERPTLSS